MPAITAVMHADGYLLGTCRKTYVDQTYGSYFFAVMHNVPRAVDYRHPRPDDMHHLINGDITRISMAIVPVYSRERNNDLLMVERIESPLSGMGAHYKGYAFETSSLRDATQLPGFAVNPDLDEELRRIVGGGVPITADPVAPPEPARLVASAMAARRQIDLSA